MQVQAANSDAKRAAGKSALIFIFIVALLDILGVSLLVPVTPYIVRDFSTDALTVALLTVVYSIAQFIAAPFLGRLSDTVGRRPVLLVCILGSSIGYLIFGIGGALWVLFLSRVIDGITGGNISVASAYIADVTPPQDRAKNFALIGAAFGLGFVLGPAISGLLLPFGYSAPVFAAAAMSLLSFIVGYFLLPESLPPSLRNHESFHLSELNPFGATTELLRRPGLNRLLTAMFVFNFAFAAFVSNIVVYMIGRFNADAGNVALALVIGGVVRIAMFPLMGKFVHWFGEKRLAVFGFVLEAATMLTFALAPDERMIYLAVIMNSIASAFIFATIGALASNQLPLNEQGKLAGVNTALAGLGDIFGPLWAGLAYDHVAPIAPYVSSAVFLLVACGILLPTKLHHPQAPTAQPAVTGE